jgi:hypothetical protein
MEKAAVAVLRHYPSIRLNGLRKYTQNFSQGIVSPGRGVNL